jgi:hypothetical protein
VSDVGTHIARWDEVYDDRLERLHGPHAVGKPCPRKPWMLVTTLDLDKGRCGACGGEVKSRL